MNSLTLLVAILPAALLALLCVRRVPEGQALTVHRFGRYVRTLVPGMNLVWPFADRIAQTINLIGHQVELPPQRLGDASVRARLHYQILDPRRAGHALEQVDAVVQARAAAALAALAADATTRADDWIAAAALLKVDGNARLARLGLRIIRCSLHPA